MTKSKEDEARVWTGEFRASDHAGTQNENVRFAQAFLDESREMERAARRASWWRWDRYLCLMTAWFVRHFALAICRYEQDRIARETADAAEVIKGDESDA